MVNTQNTISYRLGTLKEWEMSWVEDLRTYRKYLQLDFILFRLIKVYFVRYGTPLFTHQFLRNIKGEGKKKWLKKTS